MADFPVAQISKKLLAAVIGIVGAIALAASLAGGALPMLTKEPSEVPLRPGVRGAPRLNLLNIKDGAWNDIILHTKRDWQDPKPEGGK